MLEKKGKDKRYIKNLRPISLSNRDIKIITKALTKRFNKFLPSIISPQQTAYIPARSVHDNLRSIDIIKEHCASHDIEVYLVSLDAQKAFDSVSHSFIEAVLRKYDIDEQFINIFRILYRDLTARVSVNGYFTKSFHIERSVKQGDALSCVLFILCMDTLIISIKQNIMINNLRLGNMLIPKAFAYADDVVIVAPDKNSVSCAIDQYSKFSKVLGLFLNVEKTEILPFTDSTDSTIYINTLDHNEIITFSNNITICGRNFSLNKGFEYECNVTSKIEKLSSILDSWKNAPFQYMVGI